MISMRRIRVDVSNGGVKVADPRPIENYEALRSRFRTRRVLIQLSCVPCVEIGVLRHWSAWSRPPGRLFCKSNRRTGSPVVLLGSFLHLPPQWSLPLASAPSSHSGPSRPSLPRPLRVCRLPFYFLKKTIAKRTFVRPFFRSRCNWGVRFSSAYGGAMANVSNHERKRKKK